MYIYMYICMCIYIYTYMYTRICTCPYTHLRVYICVYKRDGQGSHQGIHKSAAICGQLHTYILLYINALTCINIHIYRCDG